MNLRSIIVIFAIASVPLCSQAQQRGVSKPTKADAEQVVQIISGDKVKMQQFCELANLEDQMDKADKRKDTKKVEELFHKALELAQKLGPEYIALIIALEQLDPSSKETQRIGSVLNALDKLCAKK